MTSGRRLRDLDAEQRRLLDIGTRSRALLDLAADKIEKMEGRPPPLLGDIERTAKHQRFHRSIGVVRLMATGRPVYDDGTLLAPVCVTDDPRLTAIAELAELAAITAEQLDARAREFADSEDRGLGLCAQFMAKLPEARQRDDPPPPVDRRPRSRRERALAWAAVCGEEYAPAWARIAAAPDLRGHEERTEWEVALLTDTDTDAAAVELTPVVVPEPAILKAAAAVCRELILRRAKAELTKAKRLEQARAKVRRSDDEGVILSARERDLHAELVEPISAEIAQVERLVIRSAVLVARMSTWPGHGPRVDRALRLAADVSADEGDMDQAFSTIGYARIG